MQWPYKDGFALAVAGVLDELYRQLTPLSGVAVQARLSTWMEPCPSNVA
jgi:hypothetical protein